MNGNTILQGEAGTGKTKACCGWEEPIKYLNLEDEENDQNNRLKKLIAKEFSDRMIDVSYLRKIYFADCKVGKLTKKAYDVDGINSLKAFISEVDKIIKSKPGYVSYVVDGISGLREFAHDMWCVENGRQHAVNPGDWSEVNDIVRDKLRPLVMWAKYHGVNLVMTAEMKDEYVVIIKTDKQGKKVEESVKAGRIANYKEWAAYGVNNIIEMITEKDGAKKPTGKYFAYCEKSLAGSWSENITNKSLYDLLIEKGV